MRFFRRRRGAPVSTPENPSPAQASKSLASNNSPSDHNTSPAHLIPPLVSTPLSAVSAPPFPSSLTVRAGDESSPSTTSKSLPPPPPKRPVFKDGRISPRAPELKKQSEGLPWITDEQQLPTTSLPVPPVKTSSPAPWLQNITSSSSDSSSDSDGVENAIKSNVFQKGANKAGFPTFRAAETKKIASQILIGSSSSSGSRSAKSVSSAQRSSLPSSSQYETATKPMSLPKTKKTIPYSRNVSSSSSSSPNASSVLHWKAVDTNASGTKLPLAGRQPQRGVTDAPIPTRSGGSRPVIRTGSVSSDDVALKYPVGRPTSKPGGRSASPHPFKGKKVLHTSGKRAGSRALSSGSGSSSASLTPRRLVASHQAKVLAKKKIFKTLDSNEDNSKYSIKLSEPSTVPGQSITVPRRSRALKPGRPTSRGMESADRFLSSPKLSPVGQTTVRTQSQSRRTLTPVSRRQTSTSSPYMSPSVSAGEQQAGRRMHQHGMQEDHFLQRFSTVMRKELDDRLMHAVEKGLERDVALANRVKLEQLLRQELKQAFEEDEEKRHSHLEQVRKVAHAVGDDVCDQLNRYVSQTLTEQKNDTQEKLRQQLEQCLESFAASIQAETEKTWRSSTAQVLDGLVNHLTPFREQLVASLGELKETLMKQQRDDNAAKERAFRQHVNAVEAAYVHTLKEAVDTATEYQGTADEAAAHALQQNETVGQLRRALEHLLDVNRIAREHLEYMEKREFQLRRNLGVAQHNEQQVREFLSTCVPLLSAKEFASKGIQKGRALQALHFWVQKIRQSFLKEAFKTMYHPLKVVGGNFVYSAKDEDLMKDQLQLLAENDQLHHAIRGLQLEMCHQPTEHLKRGTWIALRHFQKHVISARSLTLAQALHRWRLMLRVVRTADINKARQTQVVYRLTGFVQALFTALRLATTRQKHHVLLCFQRELAIRDPVALPRPSLERPAPYGVYTTRSQTGKKKLSFVSRFPSLDSSSEWNIPYYQHSEYTKRQALPSHYVAIEALLTDIPHTPPVHLHTPLTNPLKDKRPPFPPLQDLVTVGIPLPWSHCSERSVAMDALKAHLPPDIESPVRRAAFSPPPSYLKPVTVNNQGYPSDCTSLPLTDAAARSVQDELLAARKEEAEAKLVVQRSKELLQAYAD